MADLDYEKLGLTPPTTVVHGTADDIRSHLTPMHVIRWYQDGNKLVAETDFGQFVNHLPTDMKLDGFAEDGTPRFTKFS